MVKLADFGLAKNIKNQTGNLTEYVSTRWYRAPELVMRSQNYTQSIDIFALGCVMAEMYLNRPLFPGTSESDQLTRILSVLGTPTMQDWPEGHHIAQTKGIQFPQITATPLKQHIYQGNRADMSDDAVDLISKMLKFDKDKRITAIQCL